MMPKSVFLKLFFKQVLGVFFLFLSQMSNCSSLMCLGRKFGYVDFASEEDMQKALELNGKKVMGQELKLDKARSKDSSQEGKKGK